jgi:diguanylate cyclase (GGDEF)-like protein
VLTSSAGPLGPGLPWLWVLVLASIGLTAVVCRWLVLAAWRRREAQLTRQLHSRTAELEKLGALTERLNTAVRLEDVLEHVFDSFRPTIPYARIGFALIDRDRGTVRAVWARSDADEIALTAGYELELEQTSLGAVLANGEPRILNDLVAYLAEHPDSDSTRRIIQEGFRSSLTCPLRAMGRPVGFLFFSCFQPGAYTPDHVRVFRQVASQVSLIIEKSRVHDELVRITQELEEANETLARLASHDDLTGLPNRRSFDHHLDMEWRRASRDTHPLAVLLVDVDHFKRYNDRYGHGPGDDCLRQVSQMLGQRLRRAGEMVARYGGEEFAAILPGTSVEAAFEVADGLRRGVEELRIAHGDSPVSRWVTISIGVAGTDGGPEGLSPHALMAAADTALYRAKADGRNQVASATDPPSLAHAEGS